jgi:hypothetical protein
VFRSPPQTFIAGEETQVLARDEGALMGGSILSVLLDAELGN